ncbi:MAG: DUF4238 domain-containing protein [Propionicimonas sp.]|nr:DUF4238 domain-containing protein [Propionicimonas sp.]
MAQFLQPATRERVPDTARVRTPPPLSAAVSVSATTMVTMSDLLQPHASQREADRRARVWLNNLDRQAAVGSRHHIVPRFLLTRFASSSGQLRVRSRTDGAITLRAVGDLAIRDFYTSVADDIGFDSSLESLLSVVEGGAANVLRHHLDLRAFAHPRAFTPEERATIDTFVAMQSVRGMRMRRLIEVVTDYSVKLLNQDQLSKSEAEDLVFVPHPNEHLSVIGALAERGGDVLGRRPMSLVFLDAPLLITGDEPVVTVHSDESPILGHSGDGLSGRGQLSPPEASARGFANADLIMLAVSPSAMMLYGSAAVHRMPHEMRLAGEVAASFAAEHNDRVVAASVDWVAANPAHHAFTSMVMPPPGAVIRVHDNGSAAAAAANATVAGRPIRRLRADDVALRSGGEPV